MTRSRDVVFYENEMIEDRQKIGESTFIASDLTLESPWKGDIDVRNEEHDHRDVFDGLGVDDGDLM